MLTKPVANLKTNLYHFHGISKSNEIKSPKRTPTPLSICILFLKVFDPSRKPPICKTRHGFGQACASTKCFFT